MALSHILGFPRIGNFRQLKFAVENYWDGKLSANELANTAKQIRDDNRQYQQGLDLLPAGDFTLYDHMLSTSVTLGVIPQRFNHQAGTEVSLDTFFRMARGRAPSGEDTTACEMTKWFNTNYHYIVPEITQHQEFVISDQQLFNQIKEAQDAKVNTKAVITGPLTWLYFAKVKGQTFDRLTLLPKLITAYQEILAKIAQLKVEWVQIDEPILVLDLPQEWQQAFTTAYQTLANDQIKLLVATYFGPLKDNFTIVNQLPIQGLHIDAIDGNELSDIAQQWSTEKVLSVGIVNGRNIWSNDLRSSLNKLKPIAERFANNLWIAPSCSLLHVPVDLASEDKIDLTQKSWFAFAAQKINEVITLTKGINLGEAAIATELAQSDAIIKTRQESKQIHHTPTKQRLQNISPTDDKRQAPYEQRAIEQKQQLNLPLYPTTTIGSFPQTQEIRLTRSAYKTGKISQQEYISEIQKHIKHVIDEQEALDLDVLVHGEPERNDMVEYFGELLENFVITSFGWVQSYGSRCVKPPIIVGDVWLKQPMTVEWIQYAQSLTNRKVKGMLTGPVTILSWSFKREDETYANSALQIALALRDEVIALENAGINIIQVDEPAFRELMPLRKAEQPAYLAWAEKAFRISTSAVKNSTQIHTHMCYSEFNEIIQQIANLDADVITIETSRSDMKLLDVFKEFAYPNQIGPGVYDIHSPREPSVEEIKRLLLLAAQRIPKERLWVNPDCGLKTRKWSETRAALKALVQAAKQLRQT